MKYEQFEQFLDEDLGWRKKEISDLLFIAETNTNNEVILKSVILLLYAHWEGYIKKSSKLYIKYVAEKKIELSVLCDNFKAVALKDNISRCIELKDALTLAHEIAFMSKFIKLGSKAFSVKVDVDNDFEKEIIDTESNLKPKVFRNIVHILGLNYKRAIETREHYINSHLLANRNLIGHGSKYHDGVTKDFALVLKDLKKLKDIIFSIIDNFRDQLLKYAEKEYYLFSNSEEREEYDRIHELELENLFTKIEDSHKA